MTEREEINRQKRRDNRAGLNLGVRIGRPNIQKNAGDRILTLTSSISEGETGGLSVNEPQLCAPLRGPLL